MSLIYCKNCGHQISDKAIACPKCGVSTGAFNNEKQVPNNISNEEEMYLSALKCLANHHLAEAEYYISSLLVLNNEDTRYCDLKNKLEEEYEIVEERKRKFKRNFVLITTLVGVVVLLVVGYGLYTNFQEEIEQRKWEAISNSTEINDYVEYLNKFPNGKHKSIASEKVKRMQNELILWKKVIDQENEYNLQEYMQKFPNGKYCDEAQARMEEIQWKRAVKQNDKIGYQEYLYAYPHGKHKDTAQDRLSHIEEAEITDQEANNVATVISRYLRSLANGDEDGLIWCLNSVMKTYLGKANASKVDAIMYLHRLHAEDVYSVKITIDNIQVSKRVGIETEPEFYVKFSYDQRISREDTSKETFASFDGNAILNNRYKITSFTVKKTSHY